MQSLVQPLNFILIQSGQNRILQSSNSTISTPSIRECLGLLNEVQQFLQACSHQGQNHTKVINSETFTKDLEFYCSELDSSVQNLQLCLQIA